MPRSLFELLYTAMMKSTARSLRFEIELESDEALTLPPELAASIRGGTWVLTLEPKVESGELLRDHSAFLSGYAPEDEGLYDDV